MGGSVGEGGNGWVRGREGGNGWVDGWVREGGSGWGL